jgi:hypothetical protein
MKDLFEYNDLSQLIERSELLDEAGWLFLPKTGQLSQSTQAFVTRLVEVPPERETDRDAGIPKAAINAGYRPKILVTTLQDIVTNAKNQRPRATTSQLFTALMYYLEFDGFIDFDKYLRA